ncbi:MAG: TlpA family protein disulfide reductase [Lewinellaceae bacterium]|nr:TlpA family protein disulfide reductase [Phaeodactylibacter sp.]MCB0611820.1 TlpA family protein disulfide reductase [Phaeodactylibacter sp.]MCB9349284.1 TlpA family protein disulfide reductase [Lewinellaceae bacterium]
MNRHAQSLWILAIIFITGWTSCIVIEHPFNGLPPGPWRAVLELDSRSLATNPEGKPLPQLMNLEFEEVTQGELPFNFEVKYTDDQKFYIEIINGEERIKVEDITIGRDRSTAKDTVVINLPVYDSYIRAIFEEDVMEGEWIVKDRENYNIPFKAYQGQAYRFTTLRKPPIMDVSGRWEVTFGIEGESPYQAAGEFKQDGNHLSGTFLTETGDYRFLDGTIQHDKLYLSCFDGAHAFLFEAKIQPDSTLIGSFRSGKHYKTLWTAKANPDFQLPDPNSLTYIKEGYEGLAFSFETPEGKTISLPDPAYKDKIVLVQILGSWCPNCRDESVFLREYLAEHPEQPIAVIGLSFERYQEPEKAKKAIQTFKKALGLNYEILLAGKADTEEAAKALPMLNQVIAFPTLIVVDKAGKVRKIHTGFTGPATQEYQSFKQEFTSFINQLLEEKDNINQKSI